MAMDVEELIEHLKQYPKKAKVYVLSESPKKGNAVTLCLGKRIQEEPKFDISREGWSSREPENANAVMIY